MRLLAQLVSVLAPLYFVTAASDTTRTDALQAEADAAPFPSPGPQLVTSSKAAFCESLIGQAPVPQKTCHGLRAAQGLPPLVLNAGEGKTGTSSISVALAMLGLSAVHQGMYYTCDTNATNVTTNRSTVVDCARVQQMALPYPPLYRQLEQLPIEDYESFDYCSKLNAFDSYSDTPFHIFTPHVYAAFGPGTKIIVTIRGAADWAHRRAEWDELLNATDVAPLSWIFTKRVGDPKKKDDLREGVVGTYSASPAALEYAYLAELSMLSCIARAEDLLFINVANETKDPPALWAKISTFLNMSTGNIDLNVFPYDEPATCAAQQVTECHPDFSDAQNAFYGEESMFKREQRKNKALCRLPSCGNVPNASANGRGIL